MISTFDIQNLKKLLKDFYTAIGIRISVFDDEGKLVAEYPEEAPAFCRLIRETAQGREGCRRCDMDAFMRAKKLRKPHIYVCHAGLTEAITPIQIGGGVLGYAILAHMMPADGLEEASQRASMLAQGYGADEVRSREAVSQIAPRTAEQIEAAVNILDAVSSYMYIKNLASWKNEDISSQIEKYIQKNLDAPLTSDSICEAFHCSRSQLYHISMQAFGMGIMQYVTYCRIERAKQLLAEGKSIAETSELCGFSEYNYFCKIFRKHTGFSPASYRKALEEDRKS